MLLKHELLGVGYHCPLNIMSMIIVLCLAVRVDL